jgi:two-component system, response regulator
LSAPTVILIDDDQNDVEVALRAARRARLPVVITVFHDAREALDALGIDGNDGGEAQSLPRAIFLDLRMPLVDGWETLRRLRENSHTRDVPVIVQSWSTRHEDIERCYALGANSFVAKRLTPEDPGSYFTDAVRYWVQLNQTSADASGR